MPLESILVLVRFESGPMTNAFYFTRERLTYHSAAAVIKECYPDEVWRGIKPFQHHFFFRIEFNPRSNRLEPNLDIDSRNLAHLCAALRLLGWSGNLYYGKRPGDPEHLPAEWHWSQHVVHYPHGLP